MTIMTKFNLNGFQYSGVIAKAIGPIAASLAQDQSTVAPCKEPHLNVLPKDLPLNKSQRFSISNASSISTTSCIQSILKQSTFAASNLRFNLPSAPQGPQLSHEEPKRYTDLNLTALVKQHFSTESQNPQTIIPHPYRDTPEAQLKREERALSALRNKEDTIDSFSADETISLYSPITERRALFKAKNYVANPEFQIPQLFAQYKALEKPTQSLTEVDIENLAEHLQSLFFEPEMTSNNSRINLNQLMSKIAGYLDYTKVDLKDYVEFINQINQLISNLKNSIKKLLVLAKAYLSSALQSVKEGAIFAAEKIKQGAEIFAEFSKKALTMLLKAVLIGAVIAFTVKYLVLAYPMVCLLCLSLYLSAEFQILPFGLSHIVKQTRAKVCALVKDLIFTKESAIEKLMAQSVLATQTVQNLTEELD